MSYDHSCLVTRIQNTSGGPLTCSFLPGHGRTLDADEIVSVVGDVIEAIRHSKRTGADRVINSYLEALDSGLLTVLSTPAPVLQDDTTEAVKVLRLNSGSLGTEDVCWETSLSE